MTPFGRWGMKWEFSIAPKGRHQSSDSGALAKPREVWIIEFNKDLVSFNHFPPRLSKLKLVMHSGTLSNLLEIAPLSEEFPGAILGPSIGPRPGNSMVKYGARWWNQELYSPLYRDCTRVFKHQGFCTASSAPPTALRSSRNTQRHTNSSQTQT